MKPRIRRALWIASGLAALGVATALVLNAFQSNLVFFFTPSQVAANEAPRDRAFRIGGLVEAGSVVREKDALTVRFRVTDTARTIPVVYTGILPDLFREGQGRGRPGQARARRHVPRERSARQARRELHAARGGGGAEESGPPDRQGRLRGPEGKVAA